MGLLFEELHSSMVESQAEGGRWLVTLCLQAGRREKAAPGLAYFLFYFLGSHGMVLLVFQVGLPSSGKPPRNRTLIGPPRRVFVSIWLSQSEGKMTYTSGPWCSHSRAVDSHVVTHCVHRMRQDEASRLCTFAGQRFPCCGTGDPEG